MVSGWLAVVTSMVIGSALITVVGKAQETHCGGNVSLSEWSHLSAGGVPERLSEADETWHMYD